MRGLAILCLLIPLLSVNVSCVSYCRCANRVDPYGVGSLFKLNSKVILICSDEKGSARQIFDSSDLDSINIYCKMSTLDPRIPNAFKKLEYYSITDVGLESVSPEDFRFDNLKNLQADKNKLTSIPVGLFVHAPRLHTINLGDNKITALAADAFSELSDLSLLILDGNPIRYVDGKIILPMRYRILDFRLSWENADEFDISHMKDMFNFSVDGWWFEMSQTGVLRTRGIRSDDFRNFKVFNASGTPINGVAALFEKFGPSMEALDVSSSPIEHLDGNAFDRFTKLKYLNLSNTKLSSFDFDDLHNQTELKVLDISHNDLNEINFRPGVGSFTNLEILNLIGNKLTEIDFVTPTNFPKLTSLGISQNQFKCDHLKEFLSQWPHLTLFEIDSANQLNVRGIDCRAK